MKFIPNRNLDRELKRQLIYTQALARAAEPAAVAAKSFAPVDEGDYRDSIQVTVDGLQVRLDATDWKAHFIEWGTVDTPVFAPLRRGVRSAGLKLIER